MDVQDKRIRLVVEFTNLGDEAFSEAELNEFVREASLLDGVLIDSDFKVYWEVV